MIDCNVYHLAPNFVGYLDDDGSLNDGSLSVMPRQVDSDEDDSKQREKKASSIQKKTRKATTNQRASSSKTKFDPNSGSESVISA